MKTDLKQFFVLAVSLGLLICFGISDSCASETERKAGDRMVLEIRDVEYAFRWCPPGTFTMGSPAEETGRQSNESQHEVTLTRGFWMLETPVTQAMWESVMENNPSHFRGDRLPVERISWSHIQQYLQRLNGADVAPAGFRFSLPTEAQWEYACRAGTTTTYHFGDTPNTELANFGMSVGRTTEVGSYPANAWGLYDMHGNVWERCLDLLFPYSGDAMVDPVGTRGWDWDRVTRGGSWHSPARDCRSAHRGFSDRHRWNSSLGFRLALIFSAD